MTYSTAQVSAITDVSLRSLQWWTETGIVHPENAGEGSGKVRQWSEDDLFRVLLVKSLRKKGLGLKRVRVILKKAPIDKLADFTALIVTRKKYSIVSLEEVASIASAAAGPVTVVCSAPLLATIRNYKSPDRMRREHFGGSPAFPNRTGLHAPFRCP